MKFLEIPLLNFSKSEGFRIDYDLGDFSNILNLFNISKFDFTGMVPAKLEHEVPPNFNTHKKTTGCPKGSNGYTLEREFAVALNTFKGRAFWSAADYLLQFRASPWQRNRVELQIATPLRGNKKLR